ncbi:hypothetical protein [uncultured Ruegeria sp.]|uniref:hypothetical protein n=1 Tax=uncultured Ruegeria sp. TaxID=259304 RepID=UPI00262FB7E4|nr:hypothetical protein [uncultured Ruegeria sp.]
MVVSDRQALIEMLESRQIDAAGGKRLCLPGLTADRCDICVWGVPKTFAEQVAERVVKLIETMSLVTWNICAERQSGQGQPAIDIQWQQFATLTGQAFG